MAAFNYADPQWNWDSLTYNSKGGGQKIKSVAARQGATYEGAMAAWGKPGGAMNVTGYNPNIAKANDGQDAALSNKLGLTNSSGTGGTGITYDNPAPTGAMSPKPGGYSLQADPKPLATMTLAPVSSTPAAAGPGSFGSANTAKTFKENYPTTPSPSALPTFNPGAGSFAAPVVPASAVAPVALPGQTYKLPSPIQMAQPPAAAKPVTAAQAQNAGLSVPAPVGPIQGGKVADERTGMGGSDMSGTVGGIRGSNGTSGTSSPGNAATGGGPAPVVTPPASPGTPAASVPSPSQQGPGLMGPTTPTWTQANTTGGGAAPALSAAPSYAPWANAPAIRDPYTGMVSELQGLENPYDAAYQRAAEGRVIDRVEEQRLAASNVARSRAASRGLMSGGDSGILAGDLGNIDNAAFSERVRGLNDATMNTANQRAGFGMQRAQGLDNFGQNRAQGIMQADKSSYDRYRDLQMAPVELERTKATVAGQLLQNDQDRQNLELVRQNWDLIRQKETAGLELTLAELDMKKWLAENSGWLSILNMGFQALPGLAGVSGLMGGK